MIKGQMNDSRTHTKKHSKVAIEACVGWAGSNDGEQVLTFQ